MGNDDQFVLPCRRSSALRTQKRVSNGFTLIEVLVALVIFGIITVALSLSFETAIRNQQVNSQRSAEQGTVRAAFDFLTRDIQSAFVSANNMQGVFVAGNTSSTSSAASGSLLTLMTRTHRIQNTDLSQDSTGGSSPTFGIHSGTTDIPPQSDVDLVRYDFDPQAGTLTRTATNVPNLQNLPNASNGPETVLARQVLSISLRFYDATQPAWRTDWDYEQQNQQSSSGASGGTTGTGASATTGTTGSSSSTTAGGSQSSTATGDTALPNNVEVTLVLRNADGSSSTYITTITVLAPQPIDTATPPVNSAASGTTANVRGFGK